MIEILRNGPADLAKIRRGIKSSKLQKKSPSKGDQSAIPRYVNPASSRCGTAAAAARGSCGKSGGGALKGAKPP